MKKIVLVFLLLLLFSTNAVTAVVRGPDGRWYGNICVTQRGWQQVPWQLIGSMCFSPMWQQYGFIANS
jgi:hypothetical protein